MGNLQVNMKLLPMKLHFFFYNAGTAPVWPFMPVFAKQLGFSSAVVGTVYGCLPVIGALVKPTMGALADRWQIKKTLFISFIAITILAFVGIPWIPNVNRESKVDFHCSSDSVIKLCPEIAVDMCYQNKILEEGKNNATINCELECKGDINFLQSVCTTWNQSQFCANSLHEMKSPYLKLAQHHAKENVGIGNSSLPVVSADQTLFFQANLLPQHTLWERNCSFLRVGRVQFKDENWNVPYCNKYSTAACSMKCQNVLITEMATTKVDGAEAVRLYQFWLLFSVMIFGYWGMAIVTSLADAICFELLGDKPSAYGNQRLWGSVGWGTSSILAGILFDEFSKGSATRNYKPAIYLMLVVLILDILVSSKIQFVQSKRSPSIVRDVGKLLTEARIFIFLLWCISVGVFQALSWNFLFWYLEDLARIHGCGTVTWIKTLEGLIMGIQCLLGELPCFFFSGWILKKIGHVNAMTFVLVSHGLRYLIYGLLSNPWWALPIEFVSGFTFGMFYSTMASYASIVAPSGTEATMQGLVGALFEGVGVALGSFLAGHAINALSGGTVFFIFGSAALICAFLHALLQYFLRKRSSAVILHEGDFDRARYASPNDAIDMLDEEQQDLPLS